MTKLLEARENRRLERLLKQLARQDLLILDELGYVPFAKAGAELLFEVVSRAYERQSLMVTTNLPFEQWVEVCGSERLTEAMLDRLTEDGAIVPGDIIRSIEGQTVRTKNDLFQVLDRTRPGDRVRVTIIRRGQAQEVSVRVQAPGG